MRGAQRLRDPNGSYLFAGDRVRTSCHGREVYGVVIGTTHAWVLVKHDRAKGGTHTIQVRPWQVHAV